MIRSKDAPRGKTGWIGKKRTTAGVILFALLIAWGLTGEYIRNSEMQVEIDRLSARAAEMDAKNRELAETSRTVSSQAMLEREARLKMNLQKPGEQVVVVNGSGGATQVVTTTDAPAQAKTSNPAKWWRYFFQ